MSRTFTGLILRRTLPGLVKLAVLTVAVPVALVVVAMLALAAGTSSVAQTKDAQLWGGDAAFNLDTSQSPDVPYSAARTVAERLGADASLTPVIIVPGVIVSGSTGSAGARLVEAPADTIASISTYRLVSGEFPEAAGDVAVSAALAKELGINIGAEVTAPPGISVHVVGIYVLTEDHSSRDIVAGPRTLAQLSSDEWHKQFASAGLLAVSAAGLSDSIVADIAVAIDAHQTVTVRTTDTLRPFWIRNAQLLTLPAALMLSAGATLYTFMRSRRRRSMFSQLFGLGCDPTDISRIVWRGTMFASLLGALTGGAVGVIAGLAVRPMVAAIAGRDLNSLDWPISGFVFAAVVVLAVAAGNAFAEVKSIHRAVVSDVQGSNNDDEVLTTNEPKRLLRTGLVVASTGFVATSLVLTDGFLGAVLVIVGGCSVLLIAANAISGALLRWLRNHTSWGWLPAGMERSSSRKSTVVALVALIATSTPGALAVVNHSYDAAARAAYVPRAPEGSVTVRTSNAQVPVDDLRTRLAAVAGSTPIDEAIVDQDRESDGGRSWFGVVDGDPNSPPLSIAVASSADEARARWDIQLGEQEGGWFQNGGALILGTASGGTASVRFGTIADGQAPPPVGLTTSLPARTVTTPYARRLGPTVVITADTAAGLALPVHIIGFVFLHAANRLPGIKDAAIAAGVAPDLVWAEVGPEPTEPPVTYQTSLLLALMAVLLCVVAASIGSIRENRRTFSRLQELGARPGTLAKSQLAMSFIPPILGAFGGVILGLISAWLSLTTRGLPVAVQLQALVTPAAVGILAALLVGIVVAGSILLRSRSRSNETMSLSE